MSIAFEDQTPSKLRELQRLAAVRERIPDDESADAKSGRTVCERIQ
jgi:hypothetical protein